MPTAENYICAARDLCVFPSLTDPAQFRRHICVECGVGSHAPCSVQFHFQTATDGVIITRDHLSASARTRLDELDRGGVVSSESLVCLFCQARLRKNTATRKQPTSTSGNHAAPRMHPRPTIPALTIPAAPQKPQLSDQPSANTLRELRRAGAFFAQTFIYTTYETSSNDAKYDAIEDHFYGDPDTRKIGTLRQLVSGTGPFAILYDTQETDDSIERRLKASVCGKDTKRLQPIRP